MSEGKIDKKLFQDRKRTNILSNPEQQFITYLLPKIPNWISSDGLTAIGFFGSLMILISFLLAEYVDRSLLLLGIVGFFVQWFGDSLDGRIAFFRNKSRKWYGFALDIVMDWVSTVLIGLGYVFYASEDFKYSGFALVALYGWAMIISQLRYKITDKYTIDAGLVGPTEIRVIIGLVLLLEVLVPFSINYSVIVICVILFFINLADTKKLLDLGDERDKAEKLAKQHKD
ncbi:MULTISPECIES: CDP-alcohol phosphatidyltransferase family protein [Sphingobacterium]|jgi:phosphatidylglycerophosphate synthase|uniref:CDP-alcohol phosphatidyltransferase family protein n=1 Tax=Sphingobacterium litopenaei TaxID=2763500 RepID=A0ABR7YAQ5_9SPHI|nr:MULTISPECIES: CDP-alcohol phosphatidyltransferase family protein [Sphingobacterium]MBD1428371.1 CDP-alcohol phosphatidyltransferase family protein [Sphingobacterium litopenaei]NGM72217.1 CDP-alcohol phosphatidyltransferase [Sphingobacterium sp. SGL-16]